MSSQAHKKWAPPTDHPSHLQRQQTNLPAASIQHSKRTPAAAQNNPERRVRGMKGLGCWKNKQGREFSIDSLHITASDMHVGSCLLITAQIYTRRLLCHSVPGTICWLLCEKIGQTRASHFPPNYPHLVVLLQAAWTGKRGKKEEAKEKWKTSKERQERKRGEKPVHQPLNYFVNTKLWKLEHAHSREVFTWSGGYFKSEVKDSPWPNELSYLPPPTYPASRGERREEGAKRDDYELS